MVTHRRGRPPRRRQQGAPVPGRQDLGRNHEGRTKERRDVTHRRAGKRGRDDGIAFGSVHVRSASRVHEACAGVTRRRRHPPADRRRTEPPRHSHPDLVHYYSTGLAALTRTVERGVKRGEFRQSAVSDLPQLLVAPMTVVTVWRMLFSNRALDSCRLIETHVNIAVACIGT